jgi:opacity protein-like surface antigen
MPSFSLLKSRLCIAVVASIAILLPSFAVAQDNTSKLDLAIGYAGLREDISPNLSAINLDHVWANGWQASAAYNFRPSIGIEAQVNGFYKGLGVHTGLPLIGNIGLGNLNLYTATFGPQFKWSHSRFQPYVHALVGFAHGSVSAGGILSFLPIPTSLSSFNDFAFAADLGGGADFMVTKHVGLRGEVAYVYTRFPFSDISPTEDNSQNHLKVMGGLAFHF